MGVNVSNPLEADQGKPFFLAANYDVFGQV